MPDSAIEKVCVENDIEEEEKNNCGRDGETSNAETNVEISKDTFYETSNTETNADISKENFYETSNDETNADISKETFFVHREMRDFIRCLRNNVAYRRRFLLTLSVYLSYFTYGWADLQLGTLLPDLQLLLNIDFDSASWIYSSRGLGNVTGCLFIGILYDRFNRLVILCLCELGLAVCIACLPYSGEFPVMLGLMAITGVFFGGFTAGVYTIVPSIWGKDGKPYMQALFLSFTVGGIIVPFATKPFMTPQHSKINLLVGNATSSRADNYSESFSGSENFTESTTNSPNDSVNEDKPTDNMANRIQYAFIITSTIVALASIPFIMMAIKGGFDLRDSVNPASADNTDKIDKIERCSGKRKWVVLLCTFAANSLLCVSQVSINNFVLTFSIDYLEWDTASSVKLLSFYWVACCVGSLVGIVIVRILRTSQLLFIAYIALIFTFLMSMMAGFYEIHSLIWISIPMSGLVMVFIMPAIISWTEDHVCDVTGLVSALLMITIGLGNATSSRLIGYMMDNYSYMSFLYILFTKSCVSFIWYGAALIGRYAFLTNKESGLCR